MHLHQFDGATGEVASTVNAPYRCRSWRHPGPCRRWRASRDFSRINEALLRVRKKDVVFMVLTLDPGKWRNQFEAFREFGERWKSLRKAITRDWGGNNYVSTLETMPGTGLPHMNVVMVAPLLADQVGRRQKYVHAWLKRHAVLCGFGWRCSLERAASRRALAGYVVKLAGDMEDATARRAQAGEVVKLSQIPEQAPRHFRRIRSSVRFLPPPMKREGWTGELVKAPVPAAASAGLPEGPTLVVNRDAPDSGGGPSRPDAPSAAPPPNRALADAHDACHVERGQVVLSL